MTVLQHYIKIMLNDIMLKFPFLYVGLRKTINDIFKRAEEKKIGLEKPGNFKSLDHSTP